MNKPSEKIVTPEQLRPITKLLFNKSRLTGGELARMLKYDANALWLDVHQRGLSAKKAKRIASTCYAWAGELFRTGEKLRGLAGKAKVTRKQYSQSKSKRKVRPRRKS